MKNDLPEQSALDALLHAQRVAYLKAPFPEWETRAEHLRALRALIMDNQDALSEAISADFGHRSKDEIAMSEFWLSREEINEALSHGKKWMKPRRRAPNKWLRPATTTLMPQPLGVAGIVSPWNYPLLLTVGPLTCALAAGCRAMIKMSEYTPRTSELFAQLIARTFSPDHVTVVNGGPEIAAAFTALPFDQLTYTGSTQVGRIVMRAAAENLTPVLLELGGKSPAIVGPDARFDAAVDSIINGKTLNAGQTCIAPDYVFVPRGREQEFIARARAHFQKLYPDFASNPDFTSIVSDRHYSRLQRIADEARDAGAELHPLTEFTPDAAVRRMPTTLVTGAPEQSTVMQEEIFGPLMPVLPYDSLDDVINYVNARPRPLALYLFEESKQTIDRVMKETISGGVSVNETLMHITMPFGGVGASGMGAYHGYDGFLTYSKMKPILSQARLNARSLLLPPYGQRYRALIKLMLKL